MEGLTANVVSAVDEAATELHHISSEIWKHPELNHNEHFAHDLISDFLDAQGFAVTRKYKIDTAFRAEFGDAESGPCIAVLCEYDALPEIGHACGHNLIAEVGLAAGLGIKRAMEKSEKKIGKVVILGTPAEEGGGGKIDLIRAGAFKDIDAALMAHPCSFNLARTFASTINMAIVRFKGKAAHAAGFPWDGVNALDAAVLLYQSISCLRQQMKPSWRVHAIISNGGAKPNIIPELSVVEFYIRAPTSSELAVLRTKVNACIEGAAKVSGCTVETEYNEKPYKNVLNNDTICGRYEANAENLGVDFSINTHLIPPAMGSTDMGDVTYEVPGLHAMFYIGTDAGNHTRDYTDATGADVAQPYTLTQGKVLAMTALDLFTQPELLCKAKKEFEDGLSRG